MRTTAKLKRGDEVQICSLNTIMKHIYKEHVDDPDFCFKDIANLLFIPRYMVLHCNQKGIITNTQIMPDNKIVYQVDGRWWWPITCLKRIK